MSAHRLGLILCASCLWSGVASAKGEPPAWKLDDAKQNYELKQERPPAPAAGVRRPVFPKSLLFGKPDLPDGRQPKLVVSDPGDLVWYYALDLPQRLPKKKGRRPQTTELGGTFAVTGGKFSTTGNHAVRVRGRKARIRTSVVVRGSGKSLWLTKGTLVIQRTFDTKRGRLIEATFRFEISQEVKGVTQTDTYEGRIQPKQPLRVLGADFHVQVQKAIERGRSWLLGETLSRLGKYKGKTPSQGLGRIALACFALLRSGVPPSKLSKCFEWMARQPFHEVYSVSLWIMVLEARSIRRVTIPPRERTRSVARYRRGQTPKADRAHMERAVRWLLAVRKPGQGWWSYGGVPGDEETTRRKGDVTGPTGHDGKKAAKSGDRSNSQFAVLALHSALASGVPIPKKVWEEIARESLGAQEAKGPPVSLAGSKFTPASPYQVDLRDLKLDPYKSVARKKGAPTPGSMAEQLDGRARGWGYSMKSRTSQGYGSMTCAGTSTLAIAREGLEHHKNADPKLEAKIRDSLRDGLAWVLHNYSVSRNPRRAQQWYYYYAYSLEKAMDSAGVQRLGQREWWRDVAAELLARQTPKSGDWGKNLEHTSMSLLVLNRATLPAKLEIGKVTRKVTGRHDPAAWDRVVIAKVGQLRCRQLLGAMAGSPSEAAARLKLAKQAVKRLGARHRARLIPELIPLLNHRHKGTRRWARKTCKELGGSEQVDLLERFSHQWERVRLAREGLRFDRIPQLRTLLSANWPVPLRVHTLRCLGRLRAVEAVPELLKELVAAKDAKYRQLTWLNLIGLVGKEHHPYAATGSKRAREEQVEAWEDWWKANSGPLLVQEQVRRAVLELGVPGRGKRAGAKLTKVGKPALRPLVDALRAKRTRSKAHALLQKISGQKLPAEVQPWLDYLKSLAKK